MKVSLREQAEEAQRELARRHRSFSGQVKHGRMTEAEAAVGLSRMRAIRDTLRLFAEHEDAVRAALEQSLRRAHEAQEIEALAGDPLVGAIADAFPGAEITAVRELPDAREPEHDTDPQPEMEDATS